MIIYDYLPRVWVSDNESYYYPVVSELGITYENPKVDFTLEDCKNLDFAFSWILNPNIGLRFKHSVERCSGVKDKHDKLIYEGDIITKLYVDPSGRVTNELDTDFVYEVKFKYGVFGIETKTKFIPLQEFFIKSKGEYISNHGNKIIYGKSILAIVGNIHENKNLKLLLNS